jgi:hypothetical protein
VRLRLLSFNGFDTYAPPAILPSLFLEGRMHRVELLVQAPCGALVQKYFFTICVEHFVPLNGCAPQTKSFFSSFAF